MFYRILLFLTTILKKKISRFNMYYFLVNIEQPVQYI